MKVPEFRKRDSEAGRKVIALLEKLAEGGRKMTPADYRPTDLGQFRESEGRLYPCLAYFWPAVPLWSGY